MKGYSTGTTWSTKDFDSLSWHDAYVSGIRFGSDKIDDGVDSPEFILEIDFWVPQLRDGVVDVEAPRLCAPAELVFSEVYDLRMELGGSEGLLCGIGIESITRTLAPYAAEPKEFYTWCIKTNHPKGTISFQAAGFIQRLLADPVHSTHRRLDDERRKQLLKGKRDR
jgi:hypothetical protein